MNDNIEKITKLVDDINKYSKYHRVKRDFPIEKKSDITYDERLLGLVKQLLETLLDEYRIKVNAGALLNLSVALTIFIRNSKIDLRFDEKTCEIKSNKQKDADTEDLGIRKDNISLQFAFYNPGNDQLYVNGWLNNCCIGGTNFNPNYKQMNDFSLTFDEEGRLVTQTYRHQYLPSDFWGKNKIFLDHITEYNPDGYEITEKLIQENTNLETPYKINIKNTYKNNIQKLIARIPGFIPTYEAFDNFIIEQFDEKSIKSVFKDLYATVRKKDKTRTRINR